MSQTKTKTLLIIALTAAMSMPVYAATTDNKAVVEVLNTYLPGTSGLGKLNVSRVAVNKADKTIKIDVNETGGYIPLTAESLAGLKTDLSRALAGSDDYTVSLDVVTMNRKGVETSRRSMDELVLFAPKASFVPAEKTPFVVDHGRAAAPKGLEGKNLAMWQSHGWYFEPKLNRWEWQRARVMQTVEDLYTQSYVMPYLMPMLQNAGATVMSPRERDTNLVEIIADNDVANSKAKGIYSETGKWSTSAVPGFANKTEVLTVNQNPFREGTARVAEGGSKATAQWTADFTAPGEYAVYVSYVTEPNSADAVTYTVNSKAGERKFTVNQTMGGGTWIYLGHFPFDAGRPSKPVVELTAADAARGKVVTADAVKIGGGMGNVARIVKEPLDSIDYQYVLSGYPRFTEGARYFLQWAGAPDSVYTRTDNVNDYNDDYQSRSEWVNWLAGGSSVLPERPGLAIPVDLSFAFHTDAGTTLNDSIIGTLGIYCTDGRAYGDKFANGSSRLLSRDLTNLVMTNIVNDVRAGFEPNWTRRGMWDQSYYEARVPEVPGMLLELLSHQNFADMKYGLDPNFRFTVSRAIYKGMLQFLAHRDGRDYVVQPLPVRSFAITGSNGRYTLSWAETVDTLEATATPTYYIIEQRVNDGVFVKLAETKSTKYEVTVKDSDIHSYRIIAANDGGVAFPGEVLSLCYKPGCPNVNVVNGFTRVSAPDWFDSGEIAGFYDIRDHGVPDGKDISFIGSQFEFRRDIPWMDDDAAGFGASRADFEDKVIAGNTFDFVYTHGTAIVAAGYGFVSTSVEAFSNAGNDGDYVIVDLILGKQKEIARGRGAFGTYYKTFPTELQNRIAALTKSGKSIFVSGAYVATDLWDNPFSSPEVAEADQRFAREVLGYNWRVGQATVEGGAYTVSSRFRSLTPNVTIPFNQKLTEECYAVESPDSFYPADNAKTATFLRYTENNLIAGTAMDNGNYRALVIGFPFETIATDASRSEVMAMALKFLSERSAKTAPAKTGKKGAKAKKK